MIHSGLRRDEKRIERNFTRSRSYIGSETHKRDYTLEGSTPNNMMQIANCRHQIAICNGISRAKYVVSNAQYGEFFFEVDRGIYLTNCKPMNTYGLSEVEYRDENGRTRTEFMAFPNIVHLGNLRKAIRMLDKPDYMY